MLAAVLQVLVFGVCVGAVVWMYVDSRNDVTFLSQVTRRRSQRSRGRQATAATDRSSGEPPTGYMLLPEGSVYLVPVRPVERDSWPMKQSGEHRWAYAQVYFMTDAELAAYKAGDGQRWADCPPGAVYATSFFCIDCMMPLPAPPVSDEFPCDELHGRVIVTGAND